MDKIITGSCNCGRHVYKIPKLADMNLCRESLDIVPRLKFRSLSVDHCITFIHKRIILSRLGRLKLIETLIRLYRLPEMVWSHVSVGKTLLYVHWGHSAHIFVKTASIETSSPEPKTYTQKGDSGYEMTRAWCDGCGAGIWMRSASKPDMTFLKAGLFEPSDVPNPTMENWLKNMQPWETPAKRTQKTAEKGF